MIKMILTDIEGTTSSLSFVHDVLFPYARQHIAEYVRQQANKPEVKVLLDEVCQQAKIEFNIESISKQLIDWIDDDQKITPLKALQGMIWRDGYERGDFTGHVYSDAVDNLKKWHSRGLKLYVFSSGSVQAQKLLFGYSDVGDLTPLFSGYFDTNIGNKRDIQAYQAIAAACQTDCADILFLSDIQQELDAAKAAGMQTIWLVRDATPEPDAAHLQVNSFDHVILNQS